MSLPVLIFIAVCFTIFMLPEREPALGTVRYRLSLIRIGFLMAILALVMALAPWLPWTYNPAAWSFSLFSALLAVGLFFMAFYMKIYRLVFSDGFLTETKLGRKPRQIPLTAVDDFKPASSILGKDTTLVMAEGNIGLNDFMMVGVHPLMDLLNEEAELLRKQRRA